MLLFSEYDKSLDNIYFDENIFLYLEEIDLCKRIRENKGRILSVNIPCVHLGGLSHGDSKNLEMEKSRNWHWMWSKFYFKKKYQGYLFAFFSTLPSFLSSIIKFLSKLKIFINLRPHIPSAKIPTFILKGRVYFSFFL